MFLTKDNRIKWKQVAIAGAVTLVLVLGGIFWFDYPLFLFLRHFDCRLWRILGYVFNDKLWLMLITLMVGVFYIENSLKTDTSFKRKINTFNPGIILRDFWQKTKTNPAFFIFCSMWSAGLFAKLLKTFIGRARPILFEALDLAGFFPPSTDWVFNSMPSGHAVIAFSGLVMVGLLARKWRWATWTLAILIGVSRVCVGAHWPTDVILGAFIGMVAADIVRAFLTGGIKIKIEDK